MLWKPIILTFLIGLALAITPTRPAHASDEEALGRLLAGLVAAGIVAKVIDDRKDRDEARRREAAKKQSELASDRSFGRFGDTYHNDFRRERQRVLRPRGHAYGWKNRHNGRGHKRGWDAPRVDPILPRACRLTGFNRGDRFSVFSSYCLNRIYRDADRLPERCGSLMQTRFGIDRVYEEQCLRRAGYGVGH